MNARREYCDASERIDAIVAEMSEGDVVRVVSENDADWLVAAVACAMNTGDWMYVRRQWLAHANPMIRDAAWDEYERETAAMNADSGDCEPEEPSYFAGIRGPLNPISQEKGD